MISESIRFAPTATSLEIAASHGGAFFRAKRHAEAVLVYDAALRRAFNAQIASFLAFVLAVSSDDSVRNPTLALEWAEKSQQVDPNSVTTLNALAVALAANGRFPEAVVIAERALGAAVATNEPLAVKVSEARLEFFRSGRPWRE